MRIQHYPESTKVWLSARETYDWAHRPGAAWPCSVLSGHRLFAEFDRNGGLVDITIDGNMDKDCPVDEFNAIMEDMLGTAQPVPVNLDVMEAWNRSWDSDTIRLRAVCGTRYRGDTVTDCRRLRDCGAPDSFPKSEYDRVLGIVSNLGYCLEVDL